MLRSPPDGRSIFYWNQFDVGDVVFGGVFGWGRFESKIFTGGGVRVSFFAAPAGAVAVVQCSIFSISKDIMSTKILAIIAGLAFHRITSLLVLGQYVQYVNRTYCLTI